MKAAKIGEIVLISGVAVVAAAFVFAHNAILPPMKGQLAPAGIPGSADVDSREGSYSGGRTDDTKPPESGHAAAMPATTVVPQKPVTRSCCYKVNPGDAEQCGVITKELINEETGYVTHYTGESLCLRSDMTGPAEWADGSNCANLPCVVPVPPTPPKKPIDPQ